MTPLRYASRGLRRALPYVLLMLVAFSPAYASRSQPQATPAFSIQPGADPTAVLTKFMEYFLDHILAPLSQNVAMPRTELGLMRAAFIGQAAQVPPTERTPFQWAVATCDALGSAMDERDKYVTAIHSPQAPLVTDVSDARGKGMVKVDHTQDGQARSTAAFLASGSTNAWDQRAAVLRTNIQNLYTRVVAADKAPVPAPSSPAAPAPAAQTH